MNSGNDSENSADPSFIEWHKRRYEKERSLEILLVRLSKEYTMKSHDSPSGFKGDRCNQGMDFILPGVHAIFSFNFGHGNTRYDEPGSRAVSERGSLKIVFFFLKGNRYL